MKLLFSIIIVIILSFCIISNSFARDLDVYGNDTLSSKTRLIESKRLSESDLLFFDRFNSKMEISKLNISFSESESVVVEPVVEPVVVESVYEPDTIILYGYPSSWRTNLPYRQYKCTWDIKILDICCINPKGTYESELTRYSDDCDFDVTTGYEKDYHGFSISEYLIKIE